MGKRSRARSGAVKGVGNAPAPSRRAAAGAEPPTSGLERVKTSWKVAGAAGPELVKEPGRLPRASRGARPPRRERGERPAALWGTAPISEFAILVGVIVLGIGFARGPGPGGPAMTGGLILITIAVLEIAGREHLRGYRSHSLFLAMIIVIVVHFAIAFAIGAHRARTPVLLALDVVLFVLIATALSKQFSVARRVLSSPRSR